MFVRFVVPYRHPGLDPQRSLLSECYRLEEEGELLGHEAELFREMELWLDRNLARTDRIAVSNRQAAAEQAIPWLRLTASEHVSCMRALAALLESKGIPVQEVQTDEPGSIVYEDDHQVAAVPFIELPAEH